MNFFFSLLIWLSGLGAPQDARDAIATDTKAQIKTTHQTDRVKDRRSDRTGGTSIIVVIDDTQYKPIFD